MSNIYHLLFFFQFISKSKPKFTNNDIGLLWMSFNSFKIGYKLCYIKGYKNSYNQIYYCVDYFLLFVVLFLYNCIFIPRISF